MDLTPKQKAFVDYYLETANATESAKKAGYNAKSARQIGSENLSKPYIKAYIEERQKEIDSKRIASAKEIMEYFTAVMRGDEKDQFGLDAPLQERTRAAIELAKRKIDIDTDKGEGSVKIIVDIPRSSKSD